MADSAKVSFHHRERRYHVTDEDLIARLLGALASRHPLETYTVNTLYLDTPKGSWSKVRRGKGKAAPITKFRVRTYESGDKFFETKLHLDDGDTTKHRQPMGSYNAWILEVLKPICEVEYERRAYDYRGLRVTIDRSVWLPGSEVTLKGYVVEVKSTRSIPKWLAKLLPKEETKDWTSKSSWALSEKRKTPKPKPAQGGIVPHTPGVLVNEDGCGLVVPPALTT